jgi:hypothetical protein
MMASGGQGKEGARPARRPPGWLAALPSGHTLPGALGGRPLSTVGPLSCARLQGSSYYYFPVGTENALGRGRNTALKHLSEHDETLAAVEAAVADKLKGRGPLPQPPGADAPGGEEGLSLEELDGFEADLPESMP